MWACKAMRLWGENTFDLCRLFGPNVGDLCVLGDYSYFLFCDDY
jgi:hypothetical protein